MDGNVGDYYECRMTFTAQALIIRFVVGIRKTGPVFKFYQDTVAMFMPWPGVIERDY